MPTSCADALEAKQADTRSATAKESFCTVLLPEGDFAAEDSLLAARHTTAGPDQGCDQESRAIVDRNPLHRRKRTLSPL
jgi:hypothetical protein